MNEEDDIDEEVEEEEVEFDELEDEDDEQDEEQEDDAVASPEEPTEAAEKTFTKSDVDRMIAAEREKVELSGSLGKINSFTNEVMNSRRDVEEYRIMQEMSERGEDPLVGIRGYYRQSQEADSGEYGSKINTLNEKFGANIEEMYDKDSEFKSFVDDKIKNGIGLDVAVDWFFDKQSTVKTNVERRARDITAKGKSTAGSLENMSGSILDIDDMSDEEFDRMLKRTAK